MNSVVSLRPSSRILLSGLVGGLATASGIALTATSGWLIVRASERPIILTLLVAVVGVRAFGIARPVLRYVERLLSHDAALADLARRRSTMYAALVPLTPARLGRRSRSSVLAGVVDDITDVVDAQVRVTVPVLSGLVAGNFSGYWLGVVMLGLMGIAYGISQYIPAVVPGGAGGGLMYAPAVFAFGLVAFGFLGMGPVTIAVDSYGPVTDNAQSVYELSRIESVPGVEEQIRRDHGIEPRWEKAKLMLEENDGAGNTFKATAKPVLIGTAVVGATTMIFSIILFLAQNLAGEAPLTDLAQVAALLSPIHAPFLLGLIAGGAMIYWFTGASTQAVTTGAYRAVEFIGANIDLNSDAKRASDEDSSRVVQICTQYAQKGMFNIFLGVFFATLAFAFIEPFFFIGYLIAIAVVGLFQAIFMANAGGAWDNAKKIVEDGNHGGKGSPAHEASIIGDTVGDPFKDTAGPAINPLIKVMNLVAVLIAPAIVTLYLGDSTDQIIRWVITIVALLVLVAAIVVAKRDDVAMTDTEEPVSDPA